jgi:hypothetical protein
VFQHSLGKFGTLFDIKAMKKLFVGFWHMTGGDKPID